MILSFKFSFPFSTAKLGLPRKLKGSCMSLTAAQVLILIRASENVASDYHEAVALPGFNV